MLNRPRKTAWTLYLLTLLSALPLAAILAMTNPMPEGACSGIGFGCSLYGWDAAGLALLSSVFRMHSASPRFSDCCACFPSEWR